MKVEEITWGSFLVKWKLAPDNDQELIPAEVMVRDFEGEVMYFWRDDGTEYIAPEYGGAVMSDGEETVPRKAH